MNTANNSGQQWLTDPNNWKYGVFYYNKEDDRVLSPNRMGWRINFAQPFTLAAFALGGIAAVKISNLITVYFNM